MKTNIILKQKTFLIILIAILFLISLGINILKLLSETSNYENYQEGLSKYNSMSFTDAYHYFGKVSRFSKLKQAALFRQALCANKLEDAKSEKSRYKKIIKKYPNTSLAIRSKYQNAQLNFDLKKYKSARKEFIGLIKKYPNTDFALASKYYVAAIDINLLNTVKSKRTREKLKEQSITYLKAYLKEVPTGKFALNCVNVWLESGFELKNEDNLLIAKTYLLNQQYAKAQKYLQNTNFAVSWPYLARNSYELKDYKQLKSYTEQGIKGVDDFSVLINTDIDEKEHNDAVYKAIDLYLKNSLNVQSAISYLLSISNKKQGYDYLLYKNCNNLPNEHKIACYNTLYYKYPRGQFAAEALSNIFYSKVKYGDYNAAIKLGKKHLANFKNVKSSPEVIFWIAKSFERLRRFENAKTYYNRLLRTYPDDYYSYHAFLNLNKSRFYNIQDLYSKPVVFPYKDSNNELIGELIKVRDYGLINLLYGDEPFIKSWLLYEQGNYATSATIARDAIDKMEQKPDRKDLRWRLVYPLHYYDDVVKLSHKWRNDPILILSIVREESYFNPEAKSAVGAMGLMQLMPATARETAVRNGMSFAYPEILYNPEINLKLGNAYFANLVKIFNGNDLLSVLSYNGGMGSVNRWKNSLIYSDVDDFIEQIPYAETQNYLKKVYRSYWNYLRIYDGIKF